MEFHRFNSDGFCKDCGVREDVAADCFCDESESYSFEDKNHPAYGPAVAGYLAGVNYIASLSKKGGA